MEVSAIFHLFCEYIGWVNFSRDANHIESVVLYTLMDRIFAELDEDCCFRSHVVREDVVAQQLLMVNPS
jgi:hypothetical protein